MLKILFICHGNICRSTMAESIMTYLVENEGLESEIEIQSAATSREAIGEYVHHGTVQKLKEKGIPVVDHYAVQMRASDYDKYDYIIGMDHQNIRNILRIIGSDPDDKVYMLKEFAGDRGEVADPWYTGNFEITYQDIMRSCRALLEKLIKEEL